MAFKVSSARGQVPLPPSRVETELTSAFLPCAVASFAPLPYRQYPKIVSRVQEEDPVQIPSDDDPEQMVNIPIDITGKNPNGTEFDNLYLDVSTQQSS